MKLKMGMKTKVEEISDLPSLHYFYIFLSVFPGFFGSSLFFL